MNVHTVSFAGIRMYNDTCVLPAILLLAGNSP